MSRYAENTTVTADASRNEIEKLIARHGASNFMYGWDDEKAVIRFMIEERMVQFVVPMPNRDSDEFWLTPARRNRRSPAQAEKAYEQATRQRWRALMLVVRAKLEAVETGITTFDEEFLAHIVLPDGSTVGEFMVPQVSEAYRIGKMPGMLALGTGE